MKKVFLGLGGNIGHVKNTLQHAVDKIRALSFVFEVRVSNMYETSPVSKIPQNNFINCVCSFHTTRTPQDLLIELQKIESDLGKTQKTKDAPKDAPRPIDIDILLYEDEISATKELELPHPRFHERLFVLEPLLDLETSVFLPHSKQHFDVAKAVHAQKLKNVERVVKLKECIT